MPEGGVSGRQVLFPVRHPAAFLAPRHIARTGREVGAGDAVVDVDHRTVEHAMSLTMEAATSGDDPDRKAATDQIALVFRLKALA